MIIPRDSTRFGTGWSLLGVQKVKRIDANGSVMVSDGDGSAALFLKSCPSCAFTPPRGESSRMTFSSSHYVRRYRDGTNIMFDSAQGLMRNVSDIFGDTTKLEWNGDTLKVVRDPAQWPIKLHFSSGRLATMEDSAGSGGGSNRSYAFAYSSNDLFTITNGQESSTIELSYHITAAFPHLLGVWTNELGHATNFGYDHTRHRAATSPPGVYFAGSDAPAGAQWSLFSREAPVVPEFMFGSGTEENPRAYVHPQNAQFIIRSPRVHDTTVRTDRFGAPTEIYEPISNRVSILTRDSLSRVTQIQNTRGNTTNFVYDSLDNVIRIANSATGRVDTITYQKATVNGFEITVGPLDVRNNADSIQPSYRYSGVRLQKSWLYPDSAKATNYVIRTDGRPDTITDPAGHKTAFTYVDSARENLDNVKTETSKTFYTYDGHGRTTRIDAPQGANVVYAYDSRNRVTKHRKPDGDTTTFEYNHLRLTQVVDGRGQTYGFGYNAMGWDTAHVDPAGQVQTYMYDPNGNLALWTNRRGQTITFTYDAIDRLLTRAGAADSTTFIHVFNDSTLVAFNSATRDSLKFDLGGRLSSASTKREATTYRLEYAYDAGDRKTQLTLAAPGSPAIIAKWAYNRFGQIDTMVDSGNRTTTFGYNSDRLRDTTRYPTDGTPTVRITAPLASHAAGGIFYDKPSVDVIAGREIKLDSLTQLVGSWLSQQDTFSLPDYYVSGRLRNFHVNRTTMPGSCSSELKFGANCPSGDTINLLHFFYQYDPVGNFATSVDSLAPGNRAIRAANDFGTVDTMTYDLDGNLTERKQGGVTQKYFWNALSQLDSSQYLDNNVLQNTGKHRYDPFGRRVYHFFHGDSVQHVWDGDQTVVELDGSMAVSVKYTYEPGSLSPFSMTRGGATYYYLYDESNNVTALLKQDSTVPNRYRYFPFGFAYPRIEGVTNTHLFQGQPEDPESGLIYMRNRFYTYRARRFVSEDPIGLAGGINLYTYAGNNPITKSDPLGLQECRALYYYEYYTDTKEVIEESIRFLGYTGDCNRDQRSPGGTSQMGLLPDLEITRCGVATFFAWANLGADIVTIATLGKAIQLKALASASRVTAMSMSSQKVWIGARQISMYNYGGNLHMRSYVQLNRQAGTMAVGAGRFSLADAASAGGGYMSTSDKFSTASYAREILVGAIPIKGTLDAFQDKGRVCGG
jgi:RHS repeat-associated protein